MILLATPSSGQVMMTMEEQDHLKYRYTSTRLQDVTSQVIVVI
jgi:hypothetical protein